MPAWCLAGPGLSGSGFKFYSVMDVLCTMANLLNLSEPQSSETVLCARSAVKVK